MITMLYSWSFELNSNKSFGTPDPFIPIPSHGHPARQNKRLSPVGGEVTSRVCRRLGRPRILRSTTTIAFQDQGNSPRLHRFPVASVSSRSRFAPVNTVNIVKSTEIHVCNSLISRVCTLLRVNKTFFSALPALAETMCRRLSALLGVCSPCHFLPQIEP